MSGTHKIRNNASLMILMLHSSKPQERLNCRTFLEIAANASRKAVVNMLEGDPTWHRLGQGRISWTPAITAVLPFRSHREGAVMDMTAPRRVREGSRSEGGSSDLSPIFFVCYVTLVPILVQGCVVVRRFRRRAIVGITVVAIQRHLVRFMLQHGNVFVIAVFQVRMREDGGVTRHR